MEMIKRVLAEKRLAVTLVVVGLGIDVGLYGLAVYPWSLKVANAETRAAAAAVDREAAMQAFEYARQTLDGKTQADDELRKFYLEILPRDLAGARGITFARLAELASANSLVMERRSASPDRDEESRLARLRITMLLKGDYRDMRRFIYELETAPEFIVIEEVVLSQGDGTDDAEVLNLGLATYFWSEDVDGGAEAEDDAL